MGSNLAAEVLKREQELIIFDNLYRYGSYQNLEWLKSQGELKFIHTDIRNTNDVEKRVKDTRPNVIFHLAGQVAMTISLDNPRFDFEVNTLGTLNLLEAVRKYFPESIIIYSSTNKVYGDLEWVRYEETETRYVTPDFPKGFSETIPLDFHSPYGCSKGAADQYMLDYAKTFGLNTVVFRHSSVYGGRQFSTYNQGWIGWFCQKAIETKKCVLKEPFTISGNGKQVRDILYSDDLVECYFKAVKDIHITKGQAFNIGGGPNNNFSLLELFNYLENELNIKLKYKKTDWRKSDQKVFITDTKKAKEFFYWAPKVSKRQGINKMVEWIKSTPPIFDEVESV